MHLESYIRQWCMGEVIRCYLIRKDVNVSKCCAQVRRLICPASYRRYQRCCCMRTRQIPPRAAEPISELILELSLAWQPDRLRLVPDVNNKRDRVQVPDSEKQKRDFPIPLSKVPKRFPEVSRRLSRAAGSRWHLCLNDDMRVCSLYVHICCV